MNGIWLKSKIYCQRKNLKHQYKVTLTKYIKFEVRCTSTIISHSERAKYGIMKNLVRFSFGTEEFENLKVDILQALETIWCLLSLNLLLISLFFLISQLFYYLWRLFHMENSNHLLIWGTNLSRSCWIICYPFELLSKLSAE